MQLPIILHISAPAKVPKIVTKGQHKVTLQHIWLTVFNIEFWHIAPNALILFEEIVNVQAQFS